jgi:N-acetylmuramoyl-L-alanine amidase
MPISRIFPTAFKPSVGINLFKKGDYGIDFWEVNRFPEKENRRNHYDDRPLDTTIRYVVLHYTVGNFASALNTFTNGGSVRTSAHYLVSESEKKREVSSGQIVQIVPETQRAWHAGISSWKGTSALNGSSIGIENVNAGFKDLGVWCCKRRVWYAFDLVQIHALGRLTQGLVKRYGIHPTDVVGHADIAPSRKQDPGILFPWGILYREYGVGAWLKEARTLYSSYIVLKKNYLVA